MKYGFLIDVFLSLVKIERDQNYLTLERPAQVHTEMNCRFMLMLFIFSCLFAIVCLSVCVRAHVCLCILLLCLSVSVFLSVCLSLPLSSLSLYCSLYLFFFEIFVTLSFVLNL